MGILRWILGLPTKAKHPTPAGLPAKGVIEVEDFTYLLALREPTEREGILFTVFRQSGNVQRQEEHFSRASAIKAIQTQFRRMKQLDARIWQNTPDSIDLRRAFYNGRGRSEGKVIAGVHVEILPLQKD